MTMRTELHVHYSSVATFPLITSVLFLPSMYLLSFIFSLPVFLLLLVFTDSFAKALLFKDKEINLNLKLEIDLSSSYH